VSSVRPGWSQSKKRNQDGWHRRRAAGHGSAVVLVQLGGRTSETHCAHPSTRSDTTTGSAMLDLSASFRRACRTADTTRWRTQRSAPGFPECPPTKFVALLVAGLMSRIAHPVRKLPQAQAIRKLTSGAIHPVRPDTSEPKHAIADSASTSRTRASCA
jgi:hypothetical protein